MHPFDESVHIGNVSCANHKLTWGFFVILDKYNQIEDDLIEDFRQAFKHWDPVRMRELAGILTHFKVC